MNRETQRNPEMTIERRYHPRTELAVYALIRYRGRSFPARSRNVSSGGICLESPSLSLASGLLLEVELQLSGHRWQVPGIVVHRQPPRFGLLFRVPQPELFLAAIGEPIRLPAEPRPLPVATPPSRY